MSTPNTTSSLQSLITNTKYTSDSEVKNTNTKPLNHVQQTAQQIADRLHNPTRFPYYCKVVWRLPEHRIWFNLESALRGREPQKLFSYLCKQDMSNG